MTVASVIRNAPKVVARTIVAEGVELKEAVIEVYRFARKHDWISTLKTVFKRKYWIWWFILAATTALSAVLSAYHNQIIAAISPYRETIRHAPAVWLIPVTALVIVSFPPLFGHELIILVVGVIYGLKVGFAIACAGTYLGELACFYAFRYWLTERAAKIEAKNVAYSCLARLMREGGLGIIILVRFSAVPGHVTTAVQSTIGMSVWIYSIAATVSLPKQFALVYLGYVFGQNSLTLSEWLVTQPANTSAADYYSGANSLAQRHKISLIVFAATTIATLLAGWIVWMRIRKIRPTIVAEMEAKARALANVAETGEEDNLKDVETPFTSGQDVNGGAFAMRPLASRPTFHHADSSNSQTGLFGRGAPFGSTNSSATSGSGWNSPSLPHLPLDSQTDYFVDDDAPGEEKVKWTRRGSA